MNKLGFKLVLPILAALLLALAGYKVWLTVPSRTFPTTEAMLADVVASSPTCRAPCWQTLVMDDTDEAAFLAYVASAPGPRFVDLERQVDDYGVNVTYKWWDLQQRANYRLRLHDDEWAWLSVGWAREDEPAVEDVLTVLGAPDFYSASSTYFEDPLVFLEMYYETDGVTVQFAQEVAYEIAAGCEFNLDPQMAVRELRLFPPGRASAMARNAGYDDGSNLAPWPEGELIHLTGYLCNH